MAFFIAVKTYNLARVMPLFFFFRALILLPVAGVYLFCSRLRPQSLFFLFFFLTVSAALPHGKAGFGFLFLDSSERGEFLWLQSWVCTLKKVLRDGRWPLGQWKSESRTIVLDLRLVLTSTLTALYTISLKLIDTWSWCFYFDFDGGFETFLEIADHY